MFDDTEAEYIMSLVTKFLIGVLLGMVIGMWLFTPEADASAAVPPGELFAIVSEVEHKAPVYLMDADLVLAVIEVESGFNYKKTGSNGEIGLMQLLPIYFPKARHDLTTNIEQGIAYMGFVRENCPVKRDFTWLICYNQGLSRTPKHPKLLPYYKRIMSVYKKNKAKGQHP
jgi:hypothetical protein